MLTPDIKYYCFWISLPVTISHVLVVRIHLSSILMNFTKYLQQTTNNTNMFGYEVLKAVATGCKLVSCSVYFRS
jgi:hypothetical protein